ncbi:hypothetical protein AAHC03_025736 [Spirometra sp. Aus1]
MKLLAERLMSDGRDLLIEPHVPEGNSFCKPDIVMSTENSITVIDVAVAGEDIMDRVYAGKDRRYSAEEVEVNLRRILTKPANTPVSHIPAVFSARGTISSRSESLLRSLGLSTFDLSDLCLAVIRGSLKAYDVYARGAGGVADNRREGTREPYEAGVARAPPLLTTLLSSSYSRTSTYILDAEVRCQRDVRQGNPLSPLLFNCALSEALSYSDRQLGFDLAGTTVDSIAYADDLVLFAESPHRLQQRLDGLANGLSLAGMVLNSANINQEECLALVRAKEHFQVFEGALLIPREGDVLVLFAKRRHLDSVLSSTEPVVRAAATVPSALPGLRLAAQPVRMGHSVLASKEDARNYWRTVLYNSADGRPLAQFAKSACASHGLSSPVRVFPWLYIRG